MKSWWQVPALLLYNAHSLLCNLEIWDMNKNILKKHMFANIKNFFIRPIKLGYFPVLTYAVRISLLKYDFSLLQILLFCYLCLIIVCKFFQCLNLNRLILCNIWSKSSPFYRVPNCSKSLVMFTLVFTQAIWPLQATDC